MNRQIPAVSIIIPMYNVEKYVGECLDSILAQTFQDFEVIVVDDCSTDNSRAVVESYKPKFARGGGEKLSLLRTEKNSGGGGFPRNIGMRISRGEYLMFIDSDDIITKNSIEEFYTTAKKFNADVVACEKYFELRGKNINPYSYKTGQFVQEPTLLTKNFFDRAVALNRKEFIFSMWTKLIRRQFFIEENFEMINIAGEDALLTWCMVCSAEKYVLIPNITYVYRIHDESFSNSSDNLNVEKRIKKWIRAMAEGFKYLDNYLVQKKFFEVNLEAKYLVLDSLIKEFVEIYITPLYAQFPAFQLDELIKSELEKIPDNTALTAFLFSRMNIFNVQLNRQGALIQQMNAHIQKQNEVIRQLQAQLKK